MSHARLGQKAKWFCKGCTRVQWQGSFACRCCCGYTTSPANVVRGVVNAKGRPMARCPR